MFKHNQHPPLFSPLPSLSPPSCPPLLPNPPSPQSPDIVNLTGIESVPTIFVYKEGKIVDFTVGSVTESVLQNVVKAAFKKK